MRSSQVNKFKLFVAFKWTGYINVIIQMYYGDIKQKIVKANHEQVSCLQNMWIRKVWYDLYINALRTDRAFSIIFLAIRFNTLCPIPVVLQKYICIWNKLIVRSITYAGLQTLHNITFLENVYILQILFASSISLMI